MSFNDAKDKLRTSIQEIDKGGVPLCKMQLMGMDKLFHLEGGQDAKRTIINAISLLYSMYAGQTTHNHISRFKYAYMGSCIYLYLSIAGVFEI